MLTPNRQDEGITGASNEPRWLNFAIFASCVVMLVALVMLIIARNTGHNGLAWAGLTAFAVGSAAWLVTFGKLVILLIKDTWAARDSYGFSLTRALNRGGNHKVDADNE